MADSGIFHTSFLCPHSVKHLQMDLLVVCFLFVLGVTHSLFFTLTTPSLHYYCPSHSVYLLLQNPSHFPLCFPGAAEACASTLCFPPTARGPVQDPVLPAGSLTQTRCGFFLPFLLFPLSCPGLQGVRERRGPPPTSCSSPLPPCPVLLPSPRSEGQQCMAERVSSASSG